MASHMRDMCGLVPAPAAWSGSSGGAGADPLRPRVDWARVAFRSGVALFAALENVTCYLAFLQTKDPEENLYNKFEMHALRTPGLDTGVLTLAVLNTVYLFASWTLVAVLRLDLFKVLAVGRLGLSAACGIACLVLTFFAESTKVCPFLCTVCVLLHTAFVVFGLLRVQKGEPSGIRKALCYTALAFLGLLTFVWCLMFLLDGVAFLRDTGCRATKNRAMPVKIRGLDGWHCVRWGESHQIRHEVYPSDATYDAHCSTSFHDFGRVPAQGAEPPGRRAQLVRCPPQCQALGLGATVIGCRTYDARSSVCSAAVQMGLLGPNQGGTVRVVGRPPTSSGNYGRCNLNGILSVAAAADAGVSTTNATGQQEWSFYFQEVPGMEALDAITMHGWRRTSVDSVTQPWRSFVADVSWVVGGGELRRREVPLGPRGASADIQLDFCHDGAPAPQNSCP